MRYSTLYSLTDGLYNEAPSISVVYLEPLVISVCVKLLELKTSLENWRDDSAAESVALPEDQNSVPRVHHGWLTSPATSSKGSKAF